MGLWHAGAASHLRFKVTWRASSAGVRRRPVTVTAGLHAATSGTVTATGNGSRRSCQ